MTEIWDSDAAQNVASKTAYISSGFATTSQLNRDEIYMYEHTEMPFQTTEGRRQFSKIW